MRRINSNVPLMAVVGLIIIIIVSGCISDQNTAPTSNITQNSTITTPQLSITAEVETGLVKLNNRDGDDIDLRNITIVIEQGDASAIYEKIGQSDRFVKGDTLYLTSTDVSLNGKALNTGKISINKSGIVEGYQTAITIIHIPSGDILARITSAEGFFG